MKEKKVKTPGEILEFARLQPGGVVAATDFLHVGSRDAIDQALSRLARNGKLLRLTRGIYALPVQSKFGDHAPRTRDLLAGLSRITGDTYVLSGAAEANLFGFTTQVPTKAKYWTTGRAFILSVGKLKIEIGRSPQDIARIEGVWGKVIRAVSATGKDDVVILKARKILEGIPRPRGVLTLRGEIGEIARSLHVAA